MGCLHGYRDRPRAGYISGLLCWGCCFRLIDFLWHSGSPDPSQEIQGCAALSLVYHREEQGSEKLLLKEVDQCWGNYSSITKSVQPQFFSCVINSTNSLWG